jgi:hypothetical protein
MSRPPSPLLSDDPQLRVHSHRPLTPVNIEEITSKIFNSSTLYYLFKDNTTPLSKRGFFILAKAELGLETETIVSQEDEKTKSIGLKFCNFLLLNRQKLLEEYKEKFYHPNQEVSERVFSEYVEEVLELMNTALYETAGDENLDSNSQIRIYKSSVRNQVSAADSGVYYTHNPLRSMIIKYDERYHSITISPDYFIRCMMIDALHPKSLTLSPSPN